MPGKSRRPRVLFASSEEGTWIREDQDTLNKFAEVTRIKLRLAQPEFRTLLRELRRTDVVFVWFASLAAIPLLFLSWCFRIRVVIVAGGFDVACLPVFGHGAFAKPWPLRALRRLLFYPADVVLTVSKSSDSEAMRNARIPDKKRRLVPLGFRPLQDKIIPAWGDRREQVLCLSSARGPTFQVKGIDQFVKVASLCPNWHFVLAGTLDEQAASLLEVHRPGNLEYRGFVPFGSPIFETLVRESRCIMQLSAYESFGAAVVDAALRGCYPITSDAYALPELTEEYGSSVPYGHPELVAAELDRLATAPPDCGKIAQSFQARYDISHREASLREVVDAILSRD